MNGEFELHIDLENDAFQEDATAEVVRILRATALRLEKEQAVLEGRTFERGLLDANGNRVGHYRLSSD